MKKAVIFVAFAMLSGGGLIHSEASERGQETNVSNPSTLLRTGAAAADHKPQTNCPVMEGRRIEKFFYVDYQGWRIYVCCKPCIKAVRKNPEKYLKILQEQGVTLERVKE